MPPPVPHVIRGDRVRRRRRALDMTQTELARLAGTKQETVSAIEHGHRPGTLAILVGIAQALGTTTDYLLGLEDDAPRPRRGGRVTADAPAVAVTREG